ncbi:MAG: ABC transporter ATP-binding protein [Chloroflexota bacterium]
MRNVLRTYWDLLATYLAIQKGRVALLCTLLLTGIALQLVNPQIVRFFIDSAEQQSGVERLFGAAALFMTIAIIRQVVVLAGEYVGEVVAWTATNQLRVDLAEHCLRLDMSFHKQYKPGELIERVDGDVNALANFFSRMVIQLGSNLLLLAGVVVLLWLSDWRVGLSIVLIIALAFWVLSRLQKYTVPRWQALRAAEANLYGYLEEWLNGTEAIRSNGAVPYIMRRLYQLLRVRWQKAMHAQYMQIFVTATPITVFGLAYVAAHILGTTLFTSGAMTIGSIYVIFYYIDLIKGPLWQIRAQIADMQQAAASINRILDLRKIEPTIHDGPGVPLPDGPLAVQFDQISFHYEDEPETNVLTDLSFSLVPGTVLGLLGRTGSGKSTLTKLLFRFYDPSSGVIRLGDVEQGHGLIDIRQTHQADLRTRIGLVTQEVQLFRANVRDNLTLFDDTVADDQIIAVLHELGLSDWYDRLPDGLDSQLSTGSSGLSAGQAQLLAFARVFLTDPGLVIMDEASSRLDPATEQLIEQAIDKLLTNRTAIIVAHRLTTVQRADQIMILSDGQVVEHGQRTDLINDPQSRFYGLLQTGLEEAFA